MDQTTSTFKRILVPLDGSSLAEQALPYAEALSAATTEIVLLAVVPPVEERRDTLGHLVEPVEEFYERSKADARASLLRAARTWLGERSHVRLVVTEGDAAEEILCAAAKDDADLIVLASHGRGAVGRLAFGSVADRVAHAAPVPVMIVRPQDAAVELGPVFIGRVVVPLDGSALASLALPIATSLARQLDVALLLVRAVDLLALLGLFPTVVPPALLIDAETEAKQAMNTVAASLRATGLTVEAGVWTGPALQVIPAAARPGDLIVMTSHGRTGVRRWFLGSVAEKLVREGPGPVIVTPVRAEAQRLQPVAGPVRH